MCCCNLTAARTRTRATHARAGMKRLTLTRSVRVPAYVLNSKSSRVAADETELSCMRSLLLSW
jgi:hypothetical protein